MSQAQEAGRPLSPRVGRSWVSSYLRVYPLQIGIVFVAIVIWILFLIGSPQTFLAGNIYVAFMSTTPYFALIAIPLTLVVITGETDLSFPSVMAFGMTIFDLVFTATHNVWLGFFGCILAGIFAGFINGVIVTRFGIPSLVATIGTQFFWRGAVMVLTNGQGLGMTDVQSTFLYPALVGKIGGVFPMQFIWTIIVGLLVWFFLNRHRFGAHVYLVGDNVESARLMGINVNLTKILAFAVVGGAAAFSGFVVSEDVLFFWPTLGDGYLLTTLASVFLGGTSVFGGAGTIFGTFVACYIIGAIQGGIVAAGLTGYWTYVIYGLIIVVSVALQTVVGRRLK
ncbi:MAG TPA: ABC transporter permease [Spirochaetia bacterium]|nr:ABC transporter permease [Spirochaetia bacterium]